MQAARAGTVAAAAALQGAGLFLTWLRVALGYHTWAQVVVGYALGVAVACAWHALGAAAVLPGLDARPAAAAALYGVTAAAVAVFALNAVRWVREAREVMQQQPAGGAKHE